MPYSFEDFQINSTFTSPARTVTESDIVFFSYLSGEWSPLHTDVEYASKTLFRGRIAQGMLILAIASGLIFRTGILDPPYLKALYSIEEVRFRKPVMIGDTIRVQLEVSSKNDRDSDGIVGFKMQVINQRNEVVVEGTINLLYAKKH